MLKNRPLTWTEKQKLHPHYLDIIRHYEQVTKRPFMRDELIVLKLLVEKAYPAQIKQTISRFQKICPERFTTLSYIYRPVTNIFKNKRGN